MNQSHDIEDLKPIKWFRPGVIMILINPFFMPMELLIGLRIPKTIYSKNGKDSGHVIICSDCNSVHDSEIWSKKYNTHTRNWFGLFCPNCGKIIPCYRNIFSSFILLVTIPLWIWWIKKWKKQWLANQTSRFRFMKS